jgi:hypothetical protein
MAIYKYMHILFLVQPSWLFLCVFCRAGHFSPSHTHTHTHIHTYTHTDQLRGGHLYPRRWRTKTQRRKAPPLLLHLYEQRL